MKSLYTFKRTHNYYRHTFKVLSYIFKCSYFYIHYTHIEYIIIFFCVVYAAIAFQLLLAAKTSMTRICIQPLQEQERTLHGREKHDMKYDF